MTDQNEKFNFKKILKIADELVAQGLVSKDQMAVAKITQKNRGGDLGEILIRKGFIEEKILLDFIMKEYHVERGLLKDYPSDAGVIKIVPQSVSQKYSMIPIMKRGDILTIAMSNPINLFSLEAIKTVVKCDVYPIIVSEIEIKEAIEANYRRGDLSIIADGAMEFIDYGADAEEDNSQSLEEMASGTKVIAAVNSIIFEAYKQKASDIHIEPMEEKLRIRYRIDGVLEESLLLSRNMQLPIISRLKIIGDMDIAERRIPQDGRVKVTLRGENLDLRLSSFPTMYGEKMVLRLLPKEQVLTLQDLGFSEDEKQRFTDIIVQPYGIFLVTGPTGSGKTTTLYAALQKVNSQERNIVSVEDPIENEIPGVNQAQINVKAGMSFASALRSILRQDPDIIMVGEIRDGETANIAFRAAMTGHLVFSTLHTNTAIGAIARLKDLGVEPFLIASGLLGVMAQRLVRKICPHCKEAYSFSIEELTKVFGNMEAYTSQKELQLFRGKGCKECRMTGYLGRTGVFELINIDDEMKKMIIEEVSEDRLKEYSNKRGILSIRHTAINKLLDGSTTIEEVLRVTEKE